MRTYEELAACSLQGVTSEPPGYPTFYEAWDASDCLGYYYYYYYYCYYYYYYYYCYYYYYYYYCYYYYIIIINNI